MDSIKETAILKIDDLHTHFDTEEGLVPAVDGVSFRVHRQEILGLVGESGCGKSVTAFSVMRLIPSPPGRIPRGKILFRPSSETDEPVDLLSLAPKGARMRSIRGNQIGMIFQEPMTSLSPVHTVGNQIMEAILLHRTVDKKEARKLAVQSLKDVRLPNPENQADSYPHELSGGMRQRAMIAMALSCSPSLLIADEPTTALDVTVQAQILKLIKHLQSRERMSVLLITHDLGVIAQMADRVAVMYLGRIVEVANVTELFSDPRHPYTRALLRSIPTIGCKERLHPIQGSVPEPGQVPPGCAFRSRCPHAFNRCESLPDLAEVSQGHAVRCWLHAEEKRSV